MAQVLQGARRYDLAAPLLREVPQTFLSSIQGASLDPKPLWGPDYLQDCLCRSLPILPSASVGQSLGEALPKKVPSDKRSYAGGRQKQALLGCCSPPTEHSPH